MAILHGAEECQGQAEAHLVIVGGYKISSSTPGCGQFYLDYADEDGKRRRKPCGLTPREALDAWNNQVGIHAGEIDPADLAPEEDDGHLTVAIAVKQFLSEVKATKSDETLHAYTRDIAWFTTKLARKYVQCVTREDIILVLGKGRSEGLAQSSINRRVLAGLMALRNAGATIKLKKGDWPKVPQTDVEIYEPEQITDFFKACTDEEALLFKTYLSSGFRNREVATLTKDSVKAPAKKLGVKPRPQYRFNPKNYECREVLIPASLMEELTAHIKEVQGALVFPTKPHPKRPQYGGAKPDAHHLEMCKEIVYRAKLNCGFCVNAKGAECSDGPTCERWYLHKWRDTFATNTLRDGVDIKMLGHKNPSTTEKYLKALLVDDLEGKVESSAIVGLVTVTQRP